MIYSRFIPIKGGYHDGPRPINVQYSWLGPHVPGSSLLNVPNKQWWIPLMHFKWWSIAEKGDVRYEPGDRDRSKDRSPWQ